MFFVISSEAIVAPPSCKPTCKELAVLVPPPIIGAEFLLPRHHGTDFWLLKVARSLSAPSEHAVNSVMLMAVDEDDRRHLSFEMASQRQEINLSNIVCIEKENLIKLAVVAAGLYTFKRSEF